MTQAQQQGAAGHGDEAQRGSCPLCTPLPTSSERDIPLLLPTALPVPATPGALGGQGHQGDVHFCRKSWWGRG